MSEMIKLRMKDERDGSPDGASVKTYRKGQVYPFRKDSRLAKIFLDEGWAEEVKPPKAKKPKPKKPKGDDGGEKPQEPKGKSKPTKGDGEDD